MATISSNHDTQNPTSGRTIGATSNEARSTKFRDTSGTTIGDAVDVDEGAASKLGALAELLRSAGERVLDITRERPALALSIAAGAGFVVAGGLSSRAGRVALMSIVEYAVFRANGAKTEEARG